MDCLHYRADEVEISGDEKESSWIVYQRVCRNLASRRAPSTDRLKPPLLVPLNLIKFAGPSQLCQADHLVSDDCPTMPRSIFSGLRWRRGGEDAEWDVVEGKVRIGRDGNKRG